MDRIINVKVGGNYLSKDNKNAGVRGEGNVTKLRITFDEGWKGYAKTVTFFDALGGNPVKRIETVDLIEDITTDALTYITPIPQEPLAIAGEMTFVIDGYLDGKRQRSIADKLVVKDAPDTDTAGEPTDPTPTEPEQWQEQVDKIIDDIQQVAISRDETAQYAKDAQGYSNTAQEHSDTAQEHSKTAQGHKDNAMIYAEHAETAAERAEKAVVHEPIIIDGYWHIWNATSEKYIDTGVKGQAGSTVYLGDNPPEDADVWIDPDGDGGVDLDKKEDNENKVYTIDINKAYEPEQYPNVAAVIGAIIQNGASNEQAAIAHAESYTDYKVEQLEERVNEQTEIIKSDTEVLKSDVEGLQVRMDDEAHFRGFVQYNSEFEDLKATPNDFAYSAESGTTWVCTLDRYWVDTGKPVPDQVVPASKLQPLMNGEASTGSDNAYARGDHRHPTDTTRASAEELNNLRNEVESKENTANKTTAISSTSTDEQYPSAKAVNDRIVAKADWEQIESGTLTENVTEIVRNLPRSYKQLYWVFRVPTINPDKSTSFAKARMALYSNGNTMVSFDPGYAITDSGVEWYLSYHMQMLGKHCSVFKACKDPAAEIISNAYLQYPPFYQYALGWQPGKDIGSKGMYYLKLTMMCQTSGARYFPTGTKFELWGVRA